MLKPKVYRRVGNGGFEEIGNQCLRHLPFHHGDYEVQECNRLEGHGGLHHCNVNGCRKTWDEKELST